MNEIMQSNIGRKLEYEVSFQKERLGKQLRFLYAWVLLDDAGGHYIKMELEPEIRVAYPKIMDISQIQDEKQFEAWMDDFFIRITKLDNPKPKDIIWNPNKVHPYITITGGLRPIRDVYLRPKTGITNRLAKALIRLARNPSTSGALRKNNNRFDLLELDIAYRTSNHNRYRVNIADSFDDEFEHGCLITMRILPPKPYTFEELKLPPIVKQFVGNLKMGLVLINGVTGAGKSTTMCAIIDYLMKSRSVNLLTIENPIETIFPAEDYPKCIISQRELGVHTITLKRALMSAVRQTLNVAVIGEIRNETDVMMSLELAQSGHLILSTLHAGTVGESIGRIVDMFPASQEKKMREMIAAQYKIGLSQQLIKGIDGKPKLAMEIMRVNQKIRELIEDKLDEDEEMSTMWEFLEHFSKNTGMRSMDQSLVELYKNKQITEDDLMYNSPNLDAIVYRQGKLGIKLSARWDPTGAQLSEELKDVTNLMDDTTHSKKRIKTRTKKEKEKKSEFDLDNLSL